MKYEIGDLVSKPVTGICKIEDILYLDAQGKKCTATDAKYFQIAENLLYMELGMALGKPEEEVCKTIIDFISERGEKDQS